MAETYYTKFDDFAFIVKTPGESRCQVIAKDVVLTHSNDFDYYELFEEFNGSLFCSSADSNFESIVNLYNGPISFECIAIDRDDVTHRSLQWLKDELLKELQSRYPEEQFHELIFI
jgi:hypothetical protein